MARIQSGSEQTLTPAGEGYPVIISATAPTKARFPDLIVGQPWLDTTVPQLKRCTNADTPTYTSTEGGAAGANTALSNLASVAINLPLLPDAAAADDFGSATLPFKDIWLAGSSGTPGTNNFRVTGTATAARVITLPDATGTLVTGGGTASGANTGDQTITLTGDVTGSGTGSFAATIADNAVGLAEMAGGTAGNLITYDVNGDPAAVATGTATHVLTSNGAGAAPTFQAASAATDTSMVFSTDFAASGRHSTGTAGTGAVTFGTVGVNLATGTTAISNAAAETILIGNNNAGLFGGSPTFGVAITCRGVGAAATAYQAIFWVGASTVASNVITMTARHFGFKIGDLGGGACRLYATQANGTTETASASLATVALNDYLELVAIKNSTTSIDYYTRINDGAQSAATNLATNLPSGSGGQDRLSARVSNEGDNTTTFIFDVAGMRYRR